MRFLRFMVCARNPHPTSQYDTQVYGFHDIAAKAIEVRTWSDACRLLGTIARGLTYELEHRGVAVADMHWYLDSYSTADEVPPNYRTIT